MARQTRTVRGGEKVPMTGIIVASSTREVIPNYGVTELVSTAAAEYVLGAPVEGVEKTLICQTPTSAALVVRGSSGTGVTFGTTAQTQITFNATAAACVRLVGVNSTRWAVVSVYPDNVAANTTGTVIGTS